MLTGALGACSVALQPSRPVPGATVATTPDAPTPTPIPTLAHLSKLSYAGDDVAADADADAAAPNTGDAAASGGIVAPTPVADVPPLAAQLPVTNAPSPTPRGRGDTTTFVRRGSLLLGAASIGDRPIGDVLFDTSAGAVFLDRGVADAVPLRDLLTASTEERPNGHDDLRQLSGLALGGVPLFADSAFVVDLGATNGLVGGPLAGVVGLSALGTAPFTLDVPGAALTVHGDSTFEPPAGVPAEALRIDQGLPFVEATLGDGTSVWLLLDTGSPATIAVWRGFAKQHPGVVKPLSGAHGDDATSPTSELRGVGLFGGRYDRVPITIETGPPRLWERSRVVGRVGMGLLRNFRLTMHPSTERIWAERVTPSAER